MQGNIFSDRDTVEDINHEAGRGRAPPFKRVRVPVTHRREDVSSQLAVTVTQHAAAPPRGYLNAVQGVAFVGALLSAQ